MPDQIVVITEEEDLEAYWAEFWPSSAQEIADIAAMSQSYVLRPEQVPVQYQLQEDDEYLRDDYTLPGEGSSYGAIRYTYPNDKRPFDFREDGHEGCVTSKFPFQHHRLTKFRGNQCGLE